MRWGTKAIQDSPLSGSEGRRKSPIHTGILTKARESCEEIAGRCGEGEVYWDGAVD